VTQLALNKFSPEQFNRQAQFGFTEPIINPNTGASEAQFKPQFTLWCMPYTRTNTQNASLLGTDFQDTNQIVIRHNSSVDKGLLVQYQDHLYQIVSLSLDDSNKIVAYDILTLQVSERVGKKHG
jgi:SPP1 family predicted phage head-tail adaptor